MVQFHAVMKDETGCEFGVDVEAATRDEARAILRDSYEESRVVQLESPEDTRARERRLYQSIMDEDADYDDDSEGRW